MMIRSIARGSDYLVSFGYQAPADILGPIVRKGETKGSSKRTFVNRVYSSTNERLMNPLTVQTLWYSVK